MEANHKLALVQGRVLDDPGRYRRLVGRLIYLTITRPKLRLELCYAVHILSQFMQAPKEEQFEAARHVLRYLKGTPGYRILLRSQCDLQIRDYYDAACPLTR